MGELFFELFSNLPRQGPGDVESTVKALSLIPPLSPESRVLDIGCGTGHQTMALARHSPATIVAIDTHGPYVDALNETAWASGVADRVSARLGDMRDLPFSNHAFDVIWCEGAIYEMGVEAGLRAWSRVLVPGGYIAMTEACWTRPDPPSACREFWEQEYPAIQDIPTHLRTIDSCGYDTIGHFTLPPSSWWNDYYRPLQDNVKAFRDRHRGNADAETIADGVQREIDMWRAFSDFYSYEFFVMRLRS